MPNRLSTFFLIAVCLIALPSCASTAPARAAPRTSALDQAVEDTVVEKATGVILVARRGRAIYARVVGSTVYPQIPAPTRHTAFDLASISKMFTAVAVLRLVDQGLLDLHAPLRRYLPELRDDDITLHHALSHDTGWPAYLSGDDQTPKTGAEVLREIAAIPRTRSAGSGYLYSDVGFVALALVVERVCGLPFPEALRRLVIEPARLGSTGQYGDARWMRQPVATEYVRGEAKGSPATFRYTWNLAGTGQVVSTADDLLRLVRALTTGRLLSSPSREYLFSSGISTGGRRPYKSDDIQNVRYGPGLFHWTDRKGRRVHFHSGANSYGAHAVMFWRQEDDLFVTGLFNSGMEDETFDRSAFMNAVLTALE